MNITQAPSIFESFNARALRPDQVARTFVPSDHYERLSKRRNTVIVGPRGSGKTTLLKMLQQPALEAWDHPQADSYCSRIDFTGVFIATEVSWAAQLEALGGNGALDPESHRLLSVAAFTTHTLRSLIIAMLNRAEPVNRDVRRQFRKVDLSTSAEAEIARKLKSVWYISEAIPTLLSIKQALTARLSTIREIASREQVLPEDGRRVRLAGIDFLHIHFIQAAAFAVEVFDDVIGEGAGKWALMFDELELAPKWIRDDLLAALRASSEHFLFKLAMSPSVPDAALLETTLSAAPDQDFDQIALWYAEKNDGYAFCENLWYSMLAERGMDKAEPLDILGRSDFETPAEEWVDRGTAYAPGSRIAKRFLRLAKVDKSFRDYLKRRGVNLGKMDSIDGIQRAADLRKIAPLLVVREFYREKDDAVSRSRRTRKSALLYAGADSIFAISEGNPRWFIALVGRLLDRLKEGEKRVAPSIQADELQKAAERFAAMLRTIPVPAYEKSARGLLSLLKEVSSFFHNSLVGEEFNPDPPGTFVVDAISGSLVLTSLEQALNAGAIVYVPDDSSQILLRSLKGKRFRVSYLLAPLYGLPLRLGRPVALSRIVGVKEGAPKAQLTLPGEEL